MPSEFAATWNWKRSQRSRACAARSRMNVAERVQQFLRRRPILHALTRSFTPVSRRISSSVSAVRRPIAASSWLRVWPSRCARACIIVIWHQRMFWSTSQAATRSRSIARPLARSYAASQSSRDAIPPASRSLLPKRQTRVQNHAEVLFRLADVHALPVEDRRQAVLVIEHVADAEVAVHDARRPSVGASCAICRSIQRNAHSIAGCGLSMSARYVSSMPRRCHSQRVLVRGRATHDSAHPPRRRARCVDHREFLRELPIISARAWADSRSSATSWRGFVSPATRAISEVVFAASRTRRCDRLRAPDAAGERHPQHLELPPASSRDRRGPPG